MYIIACSTCTCTAWFLFFSCERFNGWNSNSILQYISKSEMNFFYTFTSVSVYNVHVHVFTYTCTYRSTLYMYLQISIVCICTYMYIILCAYKSACILSEVVLCIILYKYTQKPLCPSPLSGTIPLLSILSLSSSLWHPILSLLCSSSFPSTVPLLSSSSVPLLSSPLPSPFYRSGYMPQVCF